MSTDKDSKDGQTLRKKQRWEPREPRFIGPEAIQSSSGASGAGPCTRLATFMFKGGVYKTMTTILAASALAAPPYNKKVLIVDADSQCNATSFFYPEPKDWGKEAEERKRQQALKTSAADPAGVDSGSKVSKKVSLSEKGVSFPETDPFTASWFNYDDDTWLKNVDGGKVPTIYELLFSDFDDGRGEKPALKLMPVSHFQKKDFVDDMHVVCQYCSKAKAKVDLSSDDKPPRDNGWLCSPECREKRAKENNLFLLPGSTKLISLESKLSDDIPCTFTSIDKLFTELANSFKLDFIFVDLGPNHGKLNMAFALSCNAMLPPVHADFYSATSMSRMLEDKGVLWQWNEWRENFVRLNKLDAGLYRRMPKLLPFLVSGYETGKSKRSKDNGGYEFGKVDQKYAIFVASMRLLVADDTIPATIRDMFEPDEDAMVIPFCRAIDQGTNVSQTLGIAQHQIFEKDIDDLHGFSGTTQKVYKGAQKDFMQADYKYSGFNVRQHSTSQKNNKEEADCVRFHNLRERGIINDNSLSSFLLHVSKKFQGSSSQAISGGNSGGAGGERGPSVKKMKVHRKDLAGKSKKVEWSSTSSGNESESSSSTERPSKKLRVASSASVMHDGGGASTSPQAEAEDPPKKTRPKEPFLEPVEPVSGSGGKARCVVIAVFNYKGGVKKTSTAINLSATLAKNGSKVCLMDADGQCNTTAFFHPFETPNVDDPYVQSEGTIPADELPPGTKACPADSFKPKTWIRGVGTTTTPYDFDANNINGMVAPVFKGQLQNLKVPQLLSVDPAFYEGKFLLLPGSIELANVSFRNSEDVRKFRRFGIFRKMFNEIAESYSTPDSPLEFIIIDLGPSIDDINKAFVMSSDYILPPVNTDYFSASSVRGLLYEVLPSFLDWRKDHSRKFDNLVPIQKKGLKDDGYYDFKDEEWPKVLPFLAGGYPLTQDKKKESIEQVSADFIHSIRILIKGSTEAKRDATEFGDELEPLSASMIVCDGDGNAAVPFCHRLFTAPSASHAEGRPMVHLTRRKTRAETEEVTFAKERFEILASFVKEQRLICLQCRYKVSPADLLSDEGGGGSSQGQGANGESGESSASKSAKRPASAALVGEEASEPKRTSGGGRGGGPAGGGRGGGGGIDTENSATLIPAELVSFCDEKKGTFTPIYEPEDGCSYGNYRAMASVNAGDFELYVCGAAINKAFASMLKDEGHDVLGYEDMHWNFYEAVEKCIENLKRSDPRTAQEKGRQLHFLSESKPPINKKPVLGTRDMCLLLSSLPDRFTSQGVRAGTIFIDTFEETHRPFKNKANNAMIYCVGPKGNQAKDAKDFIHAVKETGKNLFRAVGLYNQPSPTGHRVPIDFVRVCLVSGGLYGHQAVTKVEVAEALISGISAGFLEERVPIHFNFAFDKDVFKIADNRLRAR